jgi:hypothetical protein
MQKFVYFDMGGLGIVDVRLLSDPTWPQEMLESILARLVWPQCSGPEPYAKAIS